MSKFIITDKTFETDFSCNLSVTRICRKSSGLYLRGNLIFVSSYNNAYLLGFSCFDFRVTTIGPEYLRTLVRSVLSCFQLRVVTYIPLFGRVKPRFGGVQPSFRQNTLISIPIMYAYLCFSSHNICWKCLFLC